MSKTTQRTNQLDDAKQRVAEIQAQRLPVVEALNSLHADLEACETFQRGATRSTSVDELAQSLSRAAALRLVIAAAEDEARAIEARLQTLNAQLRDVRIQRKERREHIEREIGALIVQLTGLREPDKPPLSARLEALSAELMDLVVNA